MPADVAALPGLDLPAVTSWVQAERPGLLAGPLTAQLVAGGRSNLTYVLDDGSRRFVLRRPPLGHVLATAHDMAREHRMISALEGTAVPVPRALALCEDDAVTGAPFYLMSHVEGRVLRTGSDLADLDTAARETLARGMMTVLADLHSVVPATVGLEGFGRPDGFMARQVRRWSAQLENSRSRELPGIERLADALAGSVPAPSGAPGPVHGGIVHGDYRLDNLIVAGPTERDALAVRAVLDWEMATVGEPLSDVGLLLAYWDGLGSRPNAVTSSLGPQAGFPTGEVLVGWYAERTGVDLSTLPWYVAFGFKIAVILEGIHFRFTQGQDGRGRLRPDRHPGPRAGGHRAWPHSADPGIPGPCRGRRRWSVDLVGPFGSGARRRDRVERGDSVDLGLDPAHGRLPRVRIGGPASREPCDLGVRKDEEPPAVQRRQHRLRDLLGTDGSPGQHRLADGSGRLQHRGPHALRAQRLHHDPAVAIGDRHPLGEGERRVLGDRVGGRARHRQQPGGRHGRQEVAPSARQPVRQQVPGRADVWE